MIPNLLNWIAMILAGIAIVCFALAIHFDPDYLSTPWRIFLLVMNLIFFGGNLYAIIYGI